MTKRLNTAVRHWMFIDRPRRLELVIKHSQSQRSSSRYSPEKNRATPTLPSSLLCLSSSLTHTHTPTHTARPAWFLFLGYISTVYVWCILYFHRLVQRRKKKAGKSNGTSTGGSTIPSHPGQRWNSLELTGLQKRWRRARRAKRSRQKEVGRGREGVAIKSLKSIF